MNTYTTRCRIAPNKPFTVLARNELGRLVGEYVGYWHEDRGVVTLYPAKNTRKMYGYLYKHEISDRLLRVVV